MVKYTDKELHELRDSPGDLGEARTLINELINHINELYDELETLDDMGWESQGEEN